MALIGRASGPNWSVKEGLVDDLSSVLVDSR